MFTHHNMMLIEVFCTESVRKEIAYLQIHSVRFLDSSIPSSEFRGNLAPLVETVPLTKSASIRVIAADSCPTFRIPGRQTPDESGSRAYHTDNDTGTQFIFRMANQPIFQKLANDLNRKRSPPDLFPTGARNFAYFDALATALHPRCRDLDSTS